MKKLLITAVWHTRVRSSNAKTEIVYRISNTRALTSIFVPIAVRPYTFVHDSEGAGEQKYRAGKVLSSGLAKTKFRTVLRT